MSTYLDRIEANIVLCGVLLKQNGDGGRWYYRLPNNEGPGSYGFLTADCAKVAALHELGVDLDCDRWDEDLRGLGLVEV